MYSHFKKYWELFFQTTQEWINDEAPHLGASLAFYSMLSLAPLLLLILTAAGIVFGSDAAQGRIVAEIRGMIGDEGARAIQAMLVDSVQKKETGFFANLLGIGMLVLGASGVFASLQRTMNRIWDVEPKADIGFRGFLYSRLFSFTMVLGTGFLLLTMLVLSAVLAALGDLWLAYMPDLRFVLQGINFLASFGIISFLFAMIFKYVPDVHIAWRDVIAGAVMTAFFFTIGKMAIGFYIGHSAFASAYGAAGSLVVVLVWVYYSAQILFFGAEFTQVQARNAGREIRPKRNAARANYKA